METFLTSIKPACNKYKIEFIMLSTAITIALVSIVLFLQSQNRSDSIIKITESAPSTSKKNIRVDIEGAVTKPGMYELAEDQRLKDAIGVAGGLSKDADQYFFAKNFNLATVLRDQQKIYIPTIAESESPQQNISSSEFTDEEGVNINTASRVELDALAGVGPTTVDKIISSRPYSSIDELVSKKILKSSVFEKIKDQLTL